MGVRVAGIFHRLHQLRELERDDRWLLLSAVWLLPVRTLQLRVGGFGMFARRRQMRAPLQLSAGRDLATLDHARRIGWIVDVAGRYGVCRGSCLSRSLTLVDLLDRHVIDNELCIGVRDPSQLLKAHAWVEHAGVVLNERADIATRFVPIPGVWPRANPGSGGASRP